MKIKAVRRPETPEQARDWARELGEQALYVAGGTGLHFMTDPAEMVAIPLDRIGLRGVECSGRHYRIGALTPLADVMNYRAERWAFHETGRRTATHQIRNISTVGGNICRVFPWCDLPVALLALEATMVLLGDDGYAVPADDYFASQPARRLANGDLLLAVDVPVLEAHMGFGYRKEVICHSGFSLMTVAARLRLEGDRIRDARVAAGAALPFPARLKQVEALLADQPATPDTFARAATEGVREVAWKGREDWSDAYAAHAAAIAVRDALDRALTFARRRDW
ncbi:MAG: FAD binding domain-containing protein [Candidatus Marinimicrobia bacterium]|nr:FAD binding domain-containing protein [Candidatus Neomarinimicrobiota bacterium]